MVGMFLKTAWWKFNHSRDLHCCVLNGLFSGAIKWIRIKSVRRINGCEFKVFRRTIAGQFKSNRIQINTRREIPVFLIHLNNFWNKRIMHSAVYNAMKIRYQFVTSSDIRFQITLRIINNRQGIAKIPKLF